MNREALIIANLWEIIHLSKQTMEVQIMSRFFVKASRAKERISRLRSSLKPEDEFTLYYHDDSDNTGDDPFYYPQLMKIMFTVESCDDDELVAIPNEELTIDVFEKLMIDCDDFVLSRDTVTKIVFRGLYKSSGFRGTTQKSDFVKYLKDCIDTLKRGDKIHVINDFSAINIQIVRIDKSTVDFIVLNYAKKEDFEGVDAKVDLAVNDTGRICWGSISISD